MNGDVAIRRPLKMEVVVIWRCWMPIYRQRSDSF